MSVWGGRDDHRGSDESLSLLYRIVPAAEEMDLLDELHREQIQAEWNSCRPYVDEPESRDLSDTHEVDDGCPALTISQILGMLEHLLGAVIIDPEDEES